VTVNLDKTAPVITSIHSPVANENGWHNSDATIIYSCEDNVSGITSCPDAVTISSEGEDKQNAQQISDLAGNIESISTTTSLDKTTPTITAQLQPAANSAGWNNSSVSISFTCADQLSGVEQCGDIITIDTEGVDQVVNGQVIDQAGNTFQLPVLVNIDRTPPSISATVSPAANDAGWHNSNVVISYTCVDALSCPSDQTINTEAQQQAVTQIVTDIADNSASIETVLNIVV